MELPHVTVQIAPFAAGGHAAIETGSFVLLEVEEFTVVYTEHLGSSLMRDRLQDIEDHRNVFNRLRMHALRSVETRKLIRNAVRELEQSSS